MTLTKTVDWDKIFTGAPIERKLRLHMGKVLTSFDMCTLFKQQPTPENAIQFVTDLVRLEEAGRAKRFWVGEGAAARIGYAAPQPDPGKDAITGEQLPPPVYVHESGAVVRPY